MSAERRWLGALLVRGLAALAWVGVARAEAPVTLTLESAMERARQQAPGLAARLAEARAERATLAEAQSAYLPTLGLSGTLGVGYVRAPEPLGSDASGQYQADAVASVRLLDFGVRAHTVEATRLRLSALGNDIELLRREAARAAAEAFLAVQMDAELLRELERALHSRREVHTAVAALVAAELRPLVDVRRSEAELLRTSLEIEIQKTQERADRSALALVLGLDPATTFELQPPDLTALRAPASVATAVERSERRDPAIIAAEQRSAEARALERRARATLWPTLDASVRAGAIGDRALARADALAPGDRVHAAAQLELTWQALDFTAWDRAERARQLTQVARASERDVRLSRRHAAYAAALQVELAQRRLEQTEQVVAMHRLTLDLLWERYRLGQASLLDVLTTQGEWQEAELARCRDRFSYDVARIHLALLTGDV